MSFTTVRFTAYLTGVFALLATAAAIFGLGTYDPETFTFDPAPVDIRLLAGAVVGTATNAMAAVAVFRGWRTDV